jgi:hypothetical protein
MLKCMKTTGPATRREEDAKGRRWGPDRCLAVHLCQEGRHIDRVQDAAQPVQGGFLSCIICSHCCALPRADYELHHALPRSDLSRADLHSIHSYSFYTITHPAQHAISPWALPTRPSVMLAAACLKHPVPPAASPAQFSPGPLLHCIAAGDCSQPGQGAQPA